MSVAPSCRYVLSGLTRADLHALESNRDVTRLKVDGPLKKSGHDFSARRSVRHKRVRARSSAVNGSKVATDLETARDDSP